MGNRLNAQPSISGGQAAQNLGLTLDPQNNLYYDSKGQYYSSPTYSSDSYSGNRNMNALSGASFSNLNPLNNSFSTGLFGKGGVGVTGQLSNNNYLFNPFTGSAKGVSAGQRSMVDAMLANQGQYNQAQSLQDMFPNLNLTPSNSVGGEGQYGAGRFLSSNTSSTK